MSNGGKQGEAGPHGQAGPHGHSGPHGQGDGAHDPGTAWDRRYTEVTWSDEPDPTMIELVSGLTPGRAVDLGGGTGRNALWLARNGWSVTVVDASAVGLGQAEQRARQMVVSITCERADLRDWVARTAYDLVVLANVHMPPPDRETLFKIAKAAVAPGGHLYVVGHHVEALGLAGPPDPRLLYTEEILTGLTTGLRIEQLRRVEHRADHGAVGADIALFATRDRTGQPDERGPFAVSGTR